MSQPPPYDRRDFLKLSGLAALSALRPLSRAMAQTPPQEPADYTLRIASGRIDLGPGHTVSTTLYNGQFPGPLLRFTEGKRVFVDVYNDTDVPEVAHWHGQMIPSDVDGAIEEGHRLPRPTRCGESVLIGHAVFTFLAALIEAFVSTASFAAAMKAA